MQPCRDSRDGGGSALHIVTLWFDPGYEGAAPGRGKKLAGCLRRIRLFLAPPSRHAPQFLAHTPPACVRGRATLLWRRDTDPAARDVTLLGIK